MLITIIYDSGYGHTAKQAQAVADGSAPTGADADTRLHQPKHEPRRGSPWRRVSGQDYLMGQELRSPRYTTNLHERLEVHLTIPGCLLMPLAYWTTVPSS